MTCGLDALMPHFDFIGVVENAAEQTKTLLEMVGLWDSHGKDYNGGKTSRGDKDLGYSFCNMPPPQPETTATATPTRSRMDTLSNSELHVSANVSTHDTHMLNTNVTAPRIGARSARYSLGFNQRGPSENYKHATNSKILFEKYYTPELLAKVKKAYAVDFNIWNEVRGRPSNHISKGSDLAVVQKFCSTSGRT